MLALCLAKLGHTATLAEDGHTGLNRSAESGIDVVLVDIDMPVMNGIAVCGAIKSNPATRHLPVVVMTGRATPDATARAFAAGAVEFISKPFSIQQLESALSLATQPHSTGT